MTAAGYIELGLGESPGPATYGYVRFWVDEDGLGWFINDADIVTPVASGFVRVGDGGVPDYLSLVDFLQDEDDHITIRDGAVTAAKLEPDLDGEPIGLNAASLGGVEASGFAASEHGHSQADIIDLTGISRSEIVLWRGAEWTNATPVTIEAAFGDKRTTVRLNKAHYPPTATIRLHAIAKSSDATDSLGVGLRRASDDVLLASGAGALTDSYALVVTSDLASSLGDGDLDVYLGAAAGTGTLSLWGAAIVISW